MSGKATVDRARESKTRRALDAGERAFTRYGFARTTMGDIAKGARMSRPALYLLFPDKETIFSRVVEEMDDAKHAEIQEAVKEADGLDEALRQACVRWGVHGVEIAAAHPDAADLFDLRFPAVRQVYRRFESMISDLIEKDAARAGIAAEPTDLARTLVYGMRGYRQVASDASEMRRLIEAQVEAVVRALRPDEAAHHVDRPAA